MNQLTKILKQKRLLRDAGTRSEAEIQKLKDIYRKGPAAYGNVANLWKTRGLNLQKVENFLQGKNAHTKYCQLPRRYPRLKVIAYDINETWSIDVAYVDKLAKYNHGVKYRLVAVDLLSRKLRVEPMRSKTAEETAKTFARMITKEKPQKVWSDNGTEFKRVFKRCCEINNVQTYTTHSEAKSAFAERNIRSLKNKKKTNTSRINRLIIILRNYKLSL